MPRKNSYKPSEHVSKVVFGATRASPGIRSDALAKETSLHETTVSTAGRMLIEMGLLTRVRKGRFFHYYPAGAESARAPVAADIVELAEIEALKAEIAELRAFKARVHAAFPDFETDPTLLKARRIGYHALMDEGNNDGADSVVIGEADNTAFVRAIVAALELAKKVED